MQIIQTIVAAFKPMSIESMLQKQLEEAERQLVETIHHLESYEHNEMLLRARIERIKAQQLKKEL